MQEALKQTQELRHRWMTLYHSNRDDQNSWQKQLPCALKALIDNSLDSLEFWVNQLTAGSRPCAGEQMVESITNEFLPQLLASLKGLEACNYSQLNHFINELSHLMAIIHTIPHGAEYGYETEAPV